MNAATGTGHRLCRYAAIRHGLTDTERAALDDALTWKSESRLAIDLTRAGHTIAPSTIYRHKIEICICIRHATLTERPTS